MAKTNWQDPQSTEIISPHISGLQEAIGKIEESIGIETQAETGIALSEVFISNDDRYRIYQAAEGKRNWLSSPAPVIKKNGVIINDDFVIEYGGGAVIFTNPLTIDDVLTADVTYTVKIEGKGLSTEDFTTEHKENLELVYGNIEVTKSPIGFPNRTDSTFSFNHSTREFTIEPTGASYDVYFKENKYTKTTAETIIIPLTTGLHYIFFDEYGTLTTNMSFPGLKNMIYISYIYCNADTEQYFCMGDERHGTVMDKDTHERLHSIDWTQWANGLQIYDFELNNPNGDNAVKVSITNGTVIDEDLNHYIQHSPTPSAFFEQILQTFARLPVMYRSGNDGIWNQDTATEFPFKNTASGRVNFNEYDGTTWKQTQALSGAFIAYYIIFAGDVHEPIKVVQGQRYDSTLEEAQANNDDRNILWGSQPFQEFKVLYKLIYQTSDSYTNARKAQLVDVLDLRAAKRAPGGGGIIPSSHSNLTGLDYANSGHTGFASSQQLEQKADIKKTITRQNWQTISGTLVDFIKAQIVAENVYGSLWCMGGTDMNGLSGFVTWKTDTGAGGTTYVDLDSVIDRKKYYRTLAHVTATWIDSTWKEIATTDKIDILFTPNTGLTVIYNNSKKINNVAYISLGIKKTDETAFTIGAQNIGILGNKPLKSEALPVYCFANAALGSSVGGTSAYADDSVGNLVMYNNSATTKSFIITGAYCIGG